MKNVIKKFNLTEAQAKKIKIGIIKDEEITLRLSTALQSEGGVPILLTKSDIKHLKDGNQHNIQISASRLQEMSKIGGFLPALGVLIPIIAAALTGGAAATSIAKNVKDMVQGGKGLGIATKIGSGTKKRKIRRGEGGVVLGPPKNK